MASIIAPHDAGPRLEWLALQGYAGLRDTSLRLTPLHVFAGDDPSLLHALARALRHATGGRGFTPELAWVAAGPRPLAPGDVAVLDHPEAYLAPHDMRAFVLSLRGDPPAPQVVVTTASPALVNHFGADEVTAVGRDAGGAPRAAPLRATRDFDRLAQLFSLGDIWMSFHDGGSGA